MKMLKYFYLSRSRGQDNSDSSDDSDSTAKRQKRDKQITRTLRGRCYKKIKLHNNN